MENFWSRIVTKNFWFKIDPEKGPLFIHNCGNRLEEKRGQHGEKSLICSRCGFEAPILFFEDDWEWKYFVRFLETIKQGEERTLFKTGYSSEDFESRSRISEAPMIVLKRIS